MDRLLSEPEVITAVISWRKTHRNAIVPYEIYQQIIAKAQLSKTDKEWIKWIESNLMEEIGSLCTREQCERVIDSEDCNKECPYYCWIERKRSIGL